MNAEEKKEPTKGQIHLQQFGYSLTMAKNMKKHGCTHPDEYREIRAKRRKEVRAIQKAKHVKALQGRKAKVSNTKK